MATFFFFEPGVKLDEKSIENGLEGQKFLVVCLFWGDCHHPNDPFDRSLTVCFVNLIIEIFVFVSLSPNTEFNIFLICHEILINFDFLMSTDLTSS